MNPYPLRRILLFSVVTLALLHVCCVGLFAQAWIPPKGEGDLTLVYHNFYTKYHTDEDGQRINDGQIRLLGLTGILDYALTDKFAVTANLPYGLGKYSGDDPHQLPIDGGNYHGAFQDLGFAARYNVRSRPLMLTPFLRFSFPMQKYEFFAHSAIGSRLWELQTGLNFGRRLDPVLPNTFFQGRYSFGLSQHIIGYRPNRHRIEFELGHFLTRKLSVRSLAYALFTQGGVRYQDIPEQGPLWVHHDQLTRVHLLNLGGGFSYSLTNSFDIFGSIMATAWSRGHHEALPAIVAGVNWSFRTRRSAVPLRLQSTFSPTARSAAF